MRRRPWNPVQITLFLGLIMTASSVSSAHNTPDGARTASKADPSAPRVIADLHVDPLLWNRDLLASEPGSQVDLPGMLEGGVNVAVFGVVSAGFPVINGWRAFGWWRGWPREARRSAWASAQYQIERLHDAVARSEGAMVMATTASEIESALRAGRVAVMLGVEGAFPLEGRVERVAQLHEAGAVYMGLAHLRSSPSAGCSYPLSFNRGLTELGRSVLAAMEEVGMFVDLAHSSKRAFWETLEATSGPVLCSHTGVAGVEKSWRNLDDAQLKAIADRGGVIGIMVATNFLGGKTIARWVEHVDHAVAVAGIDHVALGTDLDGFVPLPEGIETIADLPRLTEALEEAGYTSEQISKIMGGNFLSMMRRFRPGPTGSSEDKVSP